MDGRWEEKEKASDLELRCSMLKEEGSCSVVLVSSAVMTRAGRSIITVAALVQEQSRQNMKQFNDSSFNI